MKRAVAEAHAQVAPGRAEYGVVADDCLAHAGPRDHHDRPLLRALVSDEPTAVRRFRIGVFHHVNAGVAQCLQSVHGRPVVVRQAKTGPAGERSERHAAAHLRAHRGRPLIRVDVHRRFVGGVNPPDDVRRIGEIGLQTQRAGPDDRRARVGLAAEHVDGVRAALDERQTACAVLQTAGDRRIDGRVRANRQHGILVQRRHPARPLGGNSLRREVVDGNGGRVRVIGKAERSHVNLARERNRRIAETEDAVRAGDLVGDHGILLIDEQEIAGGERHGTETQRAARRHHQRPGGG